MSLKNIIEYLNYFWAYRKTRWGLFLGFIIILVVWYKYLLPFLPRNERKIFYEIFSFLDERKLVYPKELAYDFAIGILEFYFCQEQMGSRELRNFIKQAKNRVEYCEMVRFVNKTVFYEKRGKKR